MRHQGNKRRGGRNSGMHCNPGRRVWARPRKAHVSQHVTKRCAFVHFVLAVAIRLDKNERERETERERERERDRQRERERERERVRACVQVCLYVFVYVGVSAFLPLTG